MALAQAVRERLRELDLVAAGLRARSRQELDRVRAELADLIRAWRRLLEVHVADDRGRCPRCRGWWRARRWPCRVWLTAHEQLITYDLAADDAASETAPLPFPAAGALAPAGPLSSPSSAPGRDPRAAPGAGDIDTSGTSAPGAVPPGVTIRVRDAGPDGGCDG